MHHHTHFFLGFEMDAIFRPAEPVGRAWMRSPGTQNILQQDRAGGYEAREPQGVGPEWAGTQGYSPDLRLLDSEVREACGLEVEVRSQRLRK